MSEDKRLSALKNTLNTVAGVVEKLAAQMQALNSQISQLAGNSSKLGKAQEKAAKETGKAAKETQKSADATKNANKESKGLFSTIGKNLKTIVSFYGAYQVLNLALSAFRDLTIGSAKRAIALEKSLADLAAVAGLTSQEVSKLKDVVFDVAGVTSLTATEVVSLQKELAKLGSSVEEIEVLTKPIALLSQALGEEPGGVAATLKKTLNQFQATAEEADRFANILTGAVNETALNLNDLGTALAYVGPLGAQLGVSFEETAALLGILADNGFKASKAGTGLRQFFITAAKDGRPFNEFLEDIANKNLNVTEAVELFNKTGASQAIVLGENITKYRELSIELKESDRLFLANAKQMSSTQGQLDLLASAYDKFSTSLGESITKTNFFISVISLLNRETAGQARAYKIISESTDEGRESIDTIIKSLRRFNRTSEDSTNEVTAVSEAFDLLKLGLEGIDKEDFINKFNEQLKVTGDVQEALTNIGEEWNNVTRQQAIDLRELISLTYAQSKSIDDAYIAQEANNESVRRYTREYSELLSLSKGGTEVDKEKIALQAQINNDILFYTNQLKEAQSLGPAQEEQVRILEKRIALLTQQSIKVGELSVSEETLAGKRKSRDKEAKDRFERQLNEYIERIKETEKVIEDLSVSLGEEAFPQQIDLLNGFFGGAEDIIAEAKKRFGADSNFVKELIKTLKDTAQEINIQLPKEEEAIITLPIKEIPDIISDDLPSPELIKPAEEISKTFYDKVKEAFEGLDWGEVIVDAIDTATGAVEEFNDTALENTKNRAEQELDIIRNRYNIEEQILKSQLDNQLITESQFRQKQIDLRKAQIAQENSIEKQIFDAEKKRDRQNASTDYLEAIASIIPTLIAYDKTADPVSVLTKAAITGALATAAYGAELSAIGQRKFYPKKFAEGGFVSGPSHAEGGVPFSVQGRGGYEMEGGEFIVNKASTARHFDLLNKINKSTSRPLVGKTSFADGGLVTSPLNESVDYLKAIAEATTSTAMNVSKPVRAFVSDKDLRSNATERRIRDRNDRL